MVKMKINEAIKVRWKGLSDSQCELMSPAKTVTEIVDTGVAVTETNLSRESMKMTQTLQTIQASDGWHVQGRFSSWMYLSAQLTCLMEHKLNEWAVLR